MRGRAIRPVGIPGSAVEPWNRPHGCVFADRCDFVADECRAERPALVAAPEGSLVRCTRLPYVDAHARPQAVTLREVRGDAPASAAMGETRLTVRDLVAGYRGRVSWRGRAQSR